MTDTSATLRTTPPTTPYAMIGGARTVSDIARRFYFLIDNDPDYAELRALHGPDLEPIAQSLAGFLSGWLGGPRDWFDGTRGCIFSLHGHLRIAQSAADQWADAMQRAIAADPRVDPAIGTELAEALGRMARGMANADAPARASVAASH